MAEASIRLDWAGSRPKGLQENATLELLTEGDPRCTLIRGDNLVAMNTLCEGFRDSCMLAYLDPPFLTGKQHVRVTRRRDEKSGKILRSVSPAFDDRWSSLGEYLAALGERIEAARQLLAAPGSLIVHVDSKTSHYVKVLCDEIFGQQAFASEIIWRYRRWPAKTSNFQRVHDVLLRYQKDPSVTPRWNQLYEPLAASTLATWGDRKQRAVVGQDGRRERSSKTSDPTPGAPLGDVWDIGIVAPVSRERTGYPTQKPEALLERLITACTDRNDLILDPYAGSGTTLAVATRLGRRALGIDNSPEAFDVIRERLARTGTTPRIERVALRNEASAASRLQKQAS